MNYIVALLVPPLALLFDGRVFTAIIVFVLWAVSVVLTFGVSHILFVILAWILISQSRADRRQRDLLNAMRKND